MEKLNSILEQSLSLAGQNKIYLLMVGIVLFFTIAVYNVFALDKDMKLNKLKNEGRPKIYKTKKKVIKIGDIDKIRLKLSRSGNPLKELGLDEYRYYGFKISLAAISTLSVIDKGWTNILLYFFMGFFILDIYISMKKKRRHKLIKEVLDSFISVTIDGLQMGQVPTEIMSTAMKKIPQSNPLWVEVKILNMKLMKGNLKGALDEFRERIDMEEIDNYCFSVMQYEIGGRAVTMLKMQLDLMHTLKGNKKKIETQTKSNLSSVAVALVVVALLIIILLPLLATFKSIPVLQ